MQDATDLAAWLRLSLTPGIGNQRARQLLRAFGLPQQIFESSLAIDSLFALIERPRLLIWRTTRCATGRARGCRRVRR